MSSVDLIDDAEFLYRIYKVFFDDMGIEPNQEPYWSILAHYETCTQPLTCNQPCCQRMHHLNQHLHSCQHEYCPICIPVRWLIMCRRVSIAMNTLGAYPDFVHVDSFIRPFTHPPQPDAGDSSAT
jgi:hypothetical protein